MKEVDIEIKGQDLEELLLKLIYFALNIDSPMINIDSGTWLHVTIYLHFVVI